MADSSAVTRQDRKGRLPGREAVSGRATRTTGAWIWRAILLALLVGLYGYVVLRTAWLSDDAYISFRSIVNFISGNGLSHNAGERVQSFTHPLWALLLAGIAFLTKDIYYTSLIASMTLALSAVVLYAARIARSLWQAVLGVTIFIFSKAFVDYSTSGLENPLTYLLLVVFFGVYLKDRQVTARRPCLLSLLGSLCLLNRMDMILLIGPALVEAWWRGRRAEAAGSSSTVSREHGAAARSTPSATGGSATGRQDRGTQAATQDSALSTQHCRLLPQSSVLSPQSCRYSLSPRLRVSLSLFLGLLPFLAWEIFSVIYYGFPFPNTAYAKLNTGIPALEYMAQGLRYLQNSLRNDPLTLIVIAAALVTAGVQRNRKGLSIGIGVALYLVYVVKIGGDFMSGRFLAAPLLASVILLGTVEVRRRIAAAGYVVGAAAAAIIGLCGPFPSLLSTAEYGLGKESTIDAHGIADERGFYYLCTGLLRKPLLIAGRPWVRARPDHDAILEAAARRRRGARVLLNNDTLGMLSCFLGPEVVVSDTYALADPLLARLPMMDVPKWRIGHFQRFSPDGYLESMESGVNQLTDPDLRIFYDKLCLITRGPLFGRQRWAAILGMNLGRYDHLVHKDFYRFPPSRGMAMHLVVPRQEGIPLDAAGLTRIPDAGIIFVYPRTMIAAGLEISLDGNHDHRLVYLHKGGSTTEQAIPGRPGAAGRLTIHRLAIPESVHQKGFERIWVQPLKKSDGCRLGHIDSIDQPAASSGAHHQKYRHSQG